MSNTWVRIYYDVCKEMPFESGKKYWFALENGSVVLGTSEFRQGYSGGDFVICDDGELWSLPFVKYYMEYHKPSHPDEVSHV